MNGSVFLIRIEGIQGCVCRGDKTDAFEYVWDVSIRPTRPWIRMRFLRRGTRGWLERDVSSSTGWHVPHLSPFLVVTTRSHAVSVRIDDPRASATTSSAFLPLLFLPFVWIRLASRLASTIHSHTLTSSHLSTFVFVDGCCWTWFRWRSAGVDPTTPWLLVPLDGIERSFRSMDRNPGRVVPTSPCVPLNHPPPVSPSTVTSIQRGRSRGQERSRDHRLSPPRWDATDHPPTRNLPRASLDPSPSSTCHVALVDATFATSVEDDQTTSVDSSAASVSFPGTCEVCVCSGFIRAPSHNDDVRSRSTSATRFAT